MAGNADGGRGTDEESGEGGGSAPIVRGRPWDAPRPSRGSKTKITEIKLDFAGSEKKNENRIIGRLLGTSMGHLRQKRGYVGK